MSLDYSSSGRRVEGKERRSIHPTNLHAANQQTTLNAKS